MEHNFVVQRPAIDRMRMAYQRGISCVAGTLIQQSFEPPCRAIEEQRTDCIRSRIHSLSQHSKTTGECAGDRKSTRLNSSHLGISYAVFCLKKKTKKKNQEQ